MWKRLVGYGALLAAGTLALQWLDYQRLARVHSGDIYLFLVAAAFLVLGIVLGVRVFAARLSPSTATRRRRRRWA
jgi:hypothetical protein